MKCNWAIFLSHTHDISICFGFEKKIKIIKLAMSGAELAPLLTSG